jgi:hypothetical protein
VSRVRAAAASLCLLAFSACTRPLPEPESADAKLYAERCGTCHQPYQPKSLTPAMWQVQVDRMKGKFLEARLQPPTPAEHDRILAYLSRNAGG